MATNNLPALNMILRAQDKTAEAFKSVNRNADRVNKRLEVLEKRSSKAGRALQSAMAAAAGVISAGQIASLADEYTSLQNKLSVVSTSTEDLANVTKRLFDISQETRTGFADTSAVYARLALQAGELGLSQDKMLKITERLNQAVIVGGSTATEASNAIIQLSQGLASGALRGDELRSVLEQLPVVSRLIAREMDVTVGQLRDLGKDGKIGADIVASALLNADDVAEQFAKTSSTLSQAWTRLNNRAVIFVGEMGKSSGAIASLVSGINLVTNHFDQFANGIGAAGIGLATYFGASVIGSTVSNIRMLVASLGAASTAMVVLRGAASFMMGPLGIALTAAGAAMAYFARQTSNAATQAALIDKATNNLVNKFSDQILDGDVDLKHVVNKFAGAKEDIAKEIAAVEDLITEKTQALNVSLNESAFGMFGISGNSGELKSQIDALEARLEKLKLAFSSASDAHTVFSRQLKQQQSSQVVIQQPKITNSAFDDYLQKLKNERDLVGASADATRKASLVSKGLIAIKRQYGSVSDEMRTALENEVNSLVAAERAHKDATKAAEDRAKAAVRLSKLIKDAVSDKAERDQKGKDAITSLNQRLELGKLILEGNVAQANALSQINGLTADGVKLTDQQVQAIHKMHAELNEQQQQQGYAQTIRNLKERHKIQLLLNDGMDKQAAVESALQSLRSQGITLSQQQIAETTQLVEKTFELEEAAKKAANPSPWQQYLKTLENVSDQIQSAAQRTFQAFEDSLVSAVTSGKWHFKDFANTALAELTRIAISQSVIRPLASLVGFKDGGQVALPGFQHGGFITGKGSGTSDSILAWLSNGEYVTNAKSTKKYLPILQAINDNKDVSRAMNVPKRFSSGGMVGSSVGMPTSSRGRHSDINVVIHNNAPVDVTVKESNAAGGIRKMEMFIDQTVAKSITSGSGAAALRALGAIR